MSDWIESLELVLGWALIIGGGLVVAGVLVLALYDAWTAGWYRPVDRAVRFLRGVLLRGGLWR